MMQSAVSASSPADADTAAWVNTRLAALKLQGGDAEAARQNCEAALELRPDYPPALLLRGKLLLAEENPEEAISNLERAVQQNPLPEYQWALAEALRADGRENEAADMESRLQRRGASADPRTYSLYLATCGGDAALAVQLAERELEQREDIFTQDALAWALTAAGRMDEAKAHLALALTEGTPDARLFFHAAVIHSCAGSKEEAQTWFTRAASVMNLLLPSEQTQFLSLAQNFANTETASEN
jgi:tetratricopeptide (TPR) repeat protein